MSDKLPRPPKDASEALFWLRLIRSPRVGPATFRKLLSEHQTAERALEALPEVAEGAGLKAYSAADPEVVAREYERGRAQGAALVALGSRAYPDLLSQIPDAPPLLWAYGDLALAQRPAVAMVGARNASSLGLRMSRALARDLSKAGLVIVSGLARGIDAAAHAAALETGTIAVLAGGVDVVYPRDNAALCDKIRATGLLISEQPMGLAPQARHFPRRNRLISGLAQGLIVVEAALRSGSLITAGDASDQGREVMAVPGHPFDARAGGTNALLRDGATLVRNAEDVLAALQRPALGPPQEARVEPNRAVDIPPIVAPPAPAGEALKDRILAQLGAAPLAEDQLIRDLGVPAASVTAELTELELNGRIARAPGGLLSRPG